MKKIGIVTFQNAINLGAFLQGYALQKSIEEYNIDAKFYYKLNMWKQKYDILAKKPRKLKFNVHRYFKFYKEQKLLQMSTMKKCDILICGSDSIWDISENTTKYLPEMFGDGYITDKRMAYAASFGTMKSTKDITDKMIHSLKKFQIITVRDENSKNIIKDLIDKEVRIVADPTLIYTFKEEIPCSYKNYILVYGDFPNNIRVQIKEFAKREKLKLLSVGTYNTWCDISIPVSPFEFLGFVHNASYIFTSMYHGSIFAIKYEKLFLSYFTVKRLRKSQTTFELLGLSERIIDENSNVFEKINNPIDYILVRQKLEEFVKNSRDILKEIIE